MRKRSFTLAGHRTSVALEPEFWEALEALAADEGIALARLVARIDGERVGVARRIGLASALRLHVLVRYRDGAKNGRCGGAALR